ncbi:DUF6526 family protein [Terracidiphilus sp.]|jgi:hypothetical protein|uniref:DUF6526 family protein n=1 Tax=Terracidiphilus sp. TaxID=1964191 RepID=UPI003C148C97
MTEPQSFANHTRRDPLYHFIALPLILANFIISIVWAVQRPNFHHIWFAVFSFAVLVLVLMVRMYSAKVQDRVIRLEERLRLQSLAPQELRAQIYRLNEDQLIGLRFAADDEVVELAKQALEQNLTRKQIKERIKSWRADNWRI